MVDRVENLNEVKADFQSLYNAELPNAYFAKMDILQYQIPENAKPIINFLISQLQHSQSDTVTVLDLGCSYGVLSSLVRFDHSLNILYDRYRGEKPTDASLDRETEWYAGQPRRDDVRFYGLDISSNAINFATHVGLLDGGLAVDLEDARNTSANLLKLPKQFDLIVSTGCVGYITNQTFDKVLHHLDNNNSRIFANFVLRGFDYSQIAATLKQHGFRTAKLEDTTFVQRKFQDATEQENVLSLLSDASMSSKAHELPERDGYYRAELFISVHEGGDQSIIDELRHMRTSA